MATTTRQLTLADIRKGCSASVVSGPNQDTGASQQNSAVAIDGSSELLLADRSGLWGRIGSEGLRCLGLPLSKVGILQRVMHRTIHASTLKVHA
jgi:hypothetical protein